MVLTAQLRRGELARLRGSEDAQALHDAYADTLERYAEPWASRPTTLGSAEMRRRVHARTACRAQ
jgi:hypothetical protein